MMLAKKGGRDKEDEGSRKRGQGRKEEDERPPRGRKRTEKEYRPRKMSRRKVRLYISFLTMVLVVVGVIAAVFILYEPDEGSGYTEKSVDGSAVKIFVLSKEAGWSDQWTTEVEQGSVVTVQLKLRNTGDTRGGYEMECRNLPSGWNAEFDMPLVTLEEMGEEKNIVASVSVGSPNGGTLRFVATSTTVDGLSVYVPVTVKVTPYEKDDGGSDDGGMMIP